MKETLDEGLHGQWAVYGEGSSRAEEALGIPGQCLVSCGEWGHSTL